MEKLLFNIDSINISITDKLIYEVTSDGTTLKFEYNINKYACIIKFMKYFMLFLHNKSKKNDISLKI